MKAEDYCSGHSDSLNYKKYVEQMVSDIKKSYGGYVTAFGCLDNSGKYTEYKLARPFCKFGGTCKKLISCRKLVEIATALDKVNGEKNLRAEFENFRDLSPDFKNVAADYEEYIKKSKPAAPSNNGLQAPQKENPQKNEEQRKLFKPGFIIEISIHMKAKTSILSDLILLSRKEVENAIKDEKAREFPFNKYLINPPYQSRLGEITVMCSCTQAFSITAMFDIKGDESKILMNPGKLCINLHYICNAKPACENHCPECKLCNGTIFKSGISEDEKNAAIIGLWKLYTMIVKKALICVICRKDKQRKNYLRVCEKIASSIRSDIIDISEGAICSSCANECKLENCLICKGPLAINPLY